MNIDFEFNSLHSSPGQVEMEREVKPDLIPGVGEISTYEKPFQLVDAQDDTLRILPEGLHQLRSIVQSIDVISVVGPFHSGKSYLLNRIMNCDREYAFELGYTVDPTTKGIWMQVAYLSGGSAVAFLDTEGFAASDRTADYDAKIFSLAALLSSHLIYNSVRIIDASAVEYLELLARRARLFQMKTALSDSTQNRMNIQKPIAFPPLTWVVEDFFQDFPEGETPKMWLDRVLDAQPSDGAERTSLRDIFASTDCFPLFLPATSSSALRALDALEPAELTGEYTEGLSSLRDHLTSSLHVLRNPPAQETDASYLAQKTSGAKWTSGTHMAAILELLVDAANTNKMDSIPSLWTLFLERQVSQATEAAKVIFDKEVRTALDVSDYLLPLTESEFTEHARKSAQVAYKLFSDLLFGTASALTSNATEVLQAVFDKQTGYFAHENQMLVVEFCRKEGKRVVNEFKEKLKAYSLPQAEVKLKASMKADKDNALTSMQEKLKKYGAGSALESTKASLLNHFNELVTTNQGEIDKVLDAAKEAATVLYKKLTKDVIKDGPIAMETLEDVHKKAEQEATIKFGTRAELMKEEKTYKGHEAQCQVEIHRRFEKLKTQNKKLVKDVCSAKLSTSISQLEHDLHRLAAELPMEEQELVQSVMQRIDTALADFDQKTNEFKKFPERHEVRTELEGECNELKLQLQEENVAKWTRVVKKPLHRARQLLEEAKGNFYVGISLRRQAYRYADEEIGTALKDGLKHKARRTPLALTFANRHLSCSALVTVPEKHLSCVPP
ncbi:hypothetical protein CYMTET_21832 [Cymbomonas tetramitiformis]|uniref:GB1/RHD3-type G domain-containing protein n=1 Tax=Cymbomonas tetramitiformis TaxID=36881 RepID=A0AAE0G1E4_9CHLO|nr:hypothetical protein CYMTET_21832 [Cymbomonas tetramitiformis]